ncbi:MAG: RsmE family RNA methyltransferase, partial [Candidatus Pacebacteria bacterium]|nr:RsmE family RNA methyltransferase [Candidatus Paceibacterota bacterium]
GLTVEDRYIFGYGIDYKEYLYSITFINKNNITLNLVEIVSQEKRNQNKVILCQSIIKSGFEDIVRGATEIGVSQILPIMSERTEKKSINISRNNKIIQEAIEQSGRVDIFYIENISKLEEVFNKDNINYVFHTYDIKNDTLDNVNGYEKNTDKKNKDIYI